MRLRIDAEMCTGHGRCYALAPEVFEPDEDGRYLNFTEVPHDVNEMFPQGAVERMRQVRTQYDPDGLFRANHAI